MFESREDVLLGLLYVISKVTAGVDLPTGVLREYNSGVQVWHQRMRDGDLPEDPFDKDTRINVVLDVNPVRITLSEDIQQEVNEDGEPQTYTLKQGSHAMVERITVSQDGVVLHIISDTKDWTLDFLSHEVDKENTNVSIKE